VHAFILCCLFASCRRNPQGIEAIVAALCPIDYGVFTLDEFASAAKLCVRVQQWCRGVATAGSTEAVAALLADDRGGDGDGDGDADGDGNGGRLSDAARLRLRQMCRGPLDVPALQLALIKALLERA
jgi:hypothetical protein